MTSQICYRAKLAFMLMTLYFNQTVNSNKDAEVFQNDINAVYELSLKWKLSLNEKKSQSNNFGRQTPTSLYKLSTSCLEWVEHTKYLGGNNPVRFKI